MSVCLTNCKYESGKHDSTLNVIDHLKYLKRQQLKTWNPIIIWRFFAFDSSSSDKALWDEGSRRRRRLDIVLDGLLCCPREMHGNETLSGWIMN